MRFLKSILSAAPLRGLAAVLGFAFLPGLVAAQACPDYSTPSRASYSFNAQQLMQGQVIPMIAGGNLDLSFCGHLPGAGYVVQGSDFEVQLTGTAPGQQLRVAVDGQCDTVLLANNYDASWHFNDDSNGLNPELYLPAVDGVYDFWVGTWSPSTCQAQFTIQVVQGQQSGMTTGMCPDATLAGMPLNFSASDLAMAQRIPVVAGGNIQIYDCAQIQGVGHVVAAPDFELSLTGASPGAMLTIAYEGQCDTVLLVNDPAGQWQFNDDMNSLSAGLVLPAVDGVYDIWAGTYDTALCEVQLTLSVTGGTSGPSGKPTIGTPAITAPPVTVPPVTVPPVTIPEVTAPPVIAPPIGGPAIQIPEFIQNLGQTPPSVTTPAGEVLPDPGNLAGFRDRVGETLTFSVTGAASGMIWGSGTYTDDSRLAAAAVHAGILQPGQTGTVRVTLHGPQDGFSGSAANGVTSANFGSWGGSYTLAP